MPAAGIYRVGNCGLRTSPGVVIPCGQNCRCRAVRHHDALPSAASSSEGGTILAPAPAPGTDGGRVAPGNSPAPSRVSFANLKSNRDEAPDDGFSGIDDGRGVARARGAG